MFIVRAASGLPRPRLPRCVHLLVGRWFGFSQDLEEMLAATAAVQKQGVAKESARRAEMSEALAKWGESRVDFGKVGEAECSRKTGFSHRPTEIKHLRFFDLTPPCVDMVEKAMGNLSTEILADFRKDWHDKHLMLKHASLRLLPSHATETQTTDCFRYGLCFCQKPKLLKFVKTFGSLMRNTFHKDFQQAGHVGDTHRPFPNQR
jgi:hypothetical protein